MTTWGAGRRTGQAAIRGAAARRPARMNGRGYSLASVSPGSGGLSCGSSSFAARFFSSFSAFFCCRFSSFSRFTKL
jgi:hypothetical protein